MLYAFDNVRILDLGGPLHPSDLQRAVDECRVEQAHAHGWIDAGELPPTS